MYVPVRKSILNIEEYIPSKNKEAMESANGIKMMKLSANENSMGCSPKVKEAVLNAFEQYPFYPDMAATKLREVLSERLGIQPEQLVFGSGAFELVTLIVRTYLEEGEESISPDPSFDYCNVEVEKQGGKAVLVPLTDYHIDLGKVRAAITNKTKLIWLCNPNNPTGTILTKEEIHRFIEDTPPNILIILDEAYADFVIDRENFPDSVALVRSHPNVIVLKTLSKAYGLAGFRVGYAVADEAVATIINSVRCPFNVTAPTQIVAVAAIQDEAYYQQVLSNHKRGLKLYYEAFEELGLKYIPTNSNFILFDINKDSVKVVEAFEKEGIMVRAGVEYNLPTHIRITVGTWEENLCAVEALKKIVNK